MALVPMDMVDSMATVDTLPTHLHTPMDHMDTHLLTPMDHTDCTRGKLRLSQRLMPTTLVPMVLVPMDMVDSMATVDTLPTHTPTVMATHLHTPPMDLTGSTSVRLSQRLMLTTPEPTDMDTHLTDTDHTAMLLPHTDPTDTAVDMLTDTTTKLLFLLI